MKKQRFHYSIGGYRWAPERFWAKKGLNGQPDDFVPLTSEERREVGILWTTKGFDAAVGYIKHVERARIRQSKSIMTYGFRSKEAPRQFAYCPQLYCRTDAPLDERLWIFKKVRSILKETGGRVTVSAECELDGRYNPVNVKENYITADFSRPLCISLGNEFSKDCPVRPYHPPPSRSKAPKKAQPHKRRDVDPVR